MAPAFIHVVCKRKHAESCFLLDFYRLGDLYRGILIKMHTIQLCSIMLKYPGEEVPANPGKK